MDLGATISRAIKVTFKYPVLWALMLIPVVIGIINAVVGMAQGFTWRPQDMMGVTSSEEMLGLFARMFAIWLPLFLLQLAIGVLVAIISLVIRGGVIAGVQTIETTGTASLSVALGMGLRKVLQLLVFNIILLIPAILVGIVIFLVIGLPLIPLIQSAGAGTMTEEQMGAMGGGFLAAFCVGVILFCVILVYGLIAAGIQVMGERAIVIEGAGPIAGLQRGWALFRANLGNIILLAIIIFLIVAVVGFALSLLGQMIVLPQMGNWMQQMQQGFIPDMSDLSNLVNWPLFIIITLVGAVVGLFVDLFILVVWTLAYRQFTGSAAPRADLPPAPLPVQ